MFDWPASTQRSPTKTGPTVALAIAVARLDAASDRVGTADRHADQLAVDQLDPLLAMLAPLTDASTSLASSTSVQDDGDLGLPVGVALIDPRGHRLLELDGREPSRAWAEAGEPIEASPKAATITNARRGEQVP